MHDLHEEIFNFKISCKIYEQNVASIFKKWGVSIVEKMGYEHVFGAWVWKEQHSFEVVFN